ncbi:MAG TPA: NAD-dependent epimerase/dehydratase family protein [Longimicrobiales bacterium]|nr:NAD-dependent epimerase/dehydratase family protein [Longimicrobiales bacterium]
MAQKVLVTGGAGFIGSHVADAFIARGDRVWIVDDLSTGRESNLNSAAEFVHASVGDEKIAELFDRVGFDIVSHHAAQVDVRKSVADPRRDAQINLDGLLNILERSREHRVKRFVFVSSGGVVYGEPDARPTPETTPKNPLSPYGVSKLASEFYLSYYNKVHGLEYAALRYANVYGPRQDPHGEAGVVAIFCTRLMAGKTLTVFGDGKQTRDYVFVGDVVAANMRVVDTELESATTLDQRAFNVGTGIGTSVLQLAEVLTRIHGGELDIEHAAERAGELRHSCLDASKLRQLGWQPRTSLEDGLRATYEFIAQRRS